MIPGLETVRPLIHGLVKTRESLHSIVLSSTIAEGGKKIYQRQRQRGKS